jgi:hypothetical protein
MLLHLLVSQVHRVGFGRRRLLLVQHFVTNVTIGRRLYMLLRNGDGCCRERVRWNGHAHLHLLSLLKVSVGIDEWRRRRSGVVGGC